MRGLYICVSLLRIVAPLFNQDVRNGLPGTASIIRLCSRVRDLLFLIGRLMQQMLAAAGALTGWTPATIRELDLAGKRRRECRRGTLRARATRQCYGMVLHCVAWRLGSRRRSREGQTRAHHYWWRNACHDWRAGFGEHASPGALTRLRVIKGRKSPKRG